MTSRVLVFVFGLLVALLLLGRINRSEPAAPAPPPATVTDAPRAAPARPAPAPPASLPAVTTPAGTPTIDLLARLEGRRRLLRAVRTTYFDSLFSETDSVVRRWSEQGGLPFLVAVLPADSTQFDGPLLALVRRAVAVWESAGLGLRFTLTADTTGAQMVARTVDQLPGERAGQTDLQWTRDGAIQFAAMALARRDSKGRVIPDPARLAVAVHELGHAMGLSHSPNPDDVMYASTRTGRLSQRDQSTLALLYTLPLGSVREPVP